MSSSDPAFEPSAAATPPTRLLLRVAAADEAALAAGLGVDGVEAPAAAARLVRAAYRGPLRLLCDRPSLVDAAAGAAADAAELSFPADAFDACDAPPVPPPAGRCLVARLPLTQAVPERVAALRGWVGAVSIEVAPGERLFAVAGIAALDAVARASRAAGLGFGIGGNLEAPDIARLLLLSPDHLCFDRAARHGHRPDGPLDPHAVAVLRELIPGPGGGAGTTTGGHDHPSARDRLFVRDLVLPLSIGAYRVEEEARQRVRFCVEAEVARPAAPPRDMRDVVSYDIILETIRMLAARPHVAFVETLAEEIAATLLAQPRLVAVSVTVEKLDVAEGPVGIRIERRRP